MTKLERKWTEHCGSAGQACTLLAVAAHHEAGHAIAALQLYPPGHVSGVALCEPGDDRKGEVHYSPFGALLPTAGLEVLDDPRAYREKVIRALAARSMAGAEAERSALNLFSAMGAQFTVPVDEFVEGGAEADRRELRRALVDVLGVPAREVAEIEERGREEARELTRHPDLQWVVEALLCKDDGFMDGDELEATVSHPHPVPREELADLHHTVVVKVGAGDVDFRRLCASLRNPLRIDDIAWSRRSDPPVDSRNARSNAATRTTRG